MATVSLNKGNGRYKTMLTREELNTLTLALAVFSIEDMETEAKEQGLDLENVEYNHLAMFNTFTKVTKLYPKPDSKENGKEE